jgi:hypothetical protein|tara:strand:+ start:596 stop:778 length:183 start_codon:yes stop_codon:yes gene_type:complete
MEKCEHQFLEYTIIHKEIVKLKRINSNRLQYVNVKRTHNEHSGFSEAVCLECDEAIEWEA